MLNSHPIASNYLNTDFEDDVNYNPKAVNYSVGFLR